ncbi:Protein RTA1 [Grifola frondosa]|uniref:Protein RTA1 n=1 Tax=Grifola frondosa TaxID=5627 RepID=A0A1C7MUA5_GRIFR|nr:Protein RTA1 [Grifola frondosa]
MARRSLFDPSTSQRPIISHLLCLLYLVSSASATIVARQAEHPNEFTDPKHDIYNPLKYIASNALTAVAISLVLATAFVQTWFYWKHGGKCMLSMLIGEYAWAVGFGVRFGLHSNPDNSGIYIVEYLFIVLSPCAFIATEYVILGHIARYIKCDKHVIIPPRRITLVFVLSDVTTFLMQAAGGSLSTAHNLSLLKIGEHIFLAGLALQLASFAVFFCLALLFFYRVRRFEPQIWNQDSAKPLMHDWRALAAALALSSIGILIRCVYRTIELSQGYQGRLATTEAFFYGLDALPLFVALVVYVPFWPRASSPTSTRGCARTRRRRAAGPIHSTMVRRGLLQYFLWLFFLCSSASAAIVIRQSDPNEFTDPKDDPHNPLKYIPSNVLTTIAIALILLTAAIQTFFYMRLGGRCMLSMVIGEFAWAVGFAIRFSLHSNPDSIGTYIFEDLFIVLSACLLLIRAKYFVFNLSPLCPALRIHRVRAAGGSLSASHNVTLLKIGKDVFLAGLGLQLASFVIFFCLALLFFFRVKRFEPQIWYQDSMKPFMDDWRALAAALTLGSTCITIRCVYRTIELSQGYQGRLATTEAFFYGLDTLPLFIAIAVYVPFWPARILPGVDARIKDYVLTESNPSTIELQAKATRRRR